MFYALYQTLGPEAFDRAYRGFYRNHQATGASAADLIAAFHDASPAADSIFTEWFTTTAWYARLHSGQALKTILRGYPR